MGASIDTTDLWRDLNRKWSGSSVLGRMSSRDLRVIIAEILSPDLYDPRIPICKTTLSYLGPEDLRQLYSFLTSGILDGGEGVLRPECPVGSRGTMKGTTAREYKISMLKYIRQFGEWNPRNVHNYTPGLLEAITNYAERSARVMKNP